MTGRSLAALADSHKMPTLRPVAFGIMAFLTLFIVWAFFARLDEVAIATGEVVPQSQVQVVQHLEGGVITDIYVREGDTVQAGQELFQLLLSAQSLNPEELRVRLDGLALRRARLETEAQGQTDLSLPQAISERRPTLAQSERNSWTARQQELDQSLSVLRDQVHQRELEVEEMRSKMRSTARNLEVTREKYKISENLLGDGLTSRVDHLQLESELRSLEGDLESLQSAVPRAESALKEALGRVEETRLGFQREAREQLGETELDIARTEELMRRATEQDKRALVRSPIEGVVKNQKYHTLGGVVQAGEPILEIVPLHDKLLVEAKLQPTDVGYVRPGQPALVKVSTYDYARYGGLEGNVLLVAPDSTTDDQGNVFYRVVVETDRDWLGENRGDLPIIPGMQATVDIHTGTKSVIDYLIKPVLKLREEAFRER